MNKKKWALIMALIVCLTNVGITSNFAYAEKKNVIYTYDSLGRVKTVTYPDHTVYTYVYDKNGNIIEIKKEKNGSTTGKPDEEETTTEKPNSTEDITTEKPNEDEEITTEKANGTQDITTEKPNREEETTVENPNVEDETTTKNPDGTDGTTTEKPNGTQETTQNPSNGNNTDNPSVNETEPTITVHLSAKDIKSYNKFKKRKLVIKSLKGIQKKKQRYLKIYIKKLANTGKYPESGYEIQYATNKNFKKSKSIVLKYNKKKSVTEKKWKVKKKTYYVKARAYMITKTGKKIYSKYSKIIKISVK